MQHRSNGYICQPFLHVRKLQKNGKKCHIFIEHFIKNIYLSLHFHVQWDGNFGISYQVFHHPDFPFFSSPFQPHKYTRMWPKPRISPSYIPDGWKKFYEIIFTMFWNRGIRSILSHTCSKKEVPRYQCNAEINIVNSFRWGSRGPKTRQYRNNLLVGLALNN